MRLGNMVYKNLAAEMVKKGINRKDFDGAKHF